MNSTAAINIGCFFALGFPHKTWRDILQTLRDIPQCVAYDNIQPQSNVR